VLLLVVFLVCGLWLLICLISCGLCLIVVVDGFWMMCMSWKICGSVRFDGGDVFGVMWYSL